MSVLQQMLEKYDTTTAEGAINGLREVMQEVALAGLYRGGFFDKAAFYGGTCLRIFYGLPRSCGIGRLLSRLSGLAFQNLRD